ncbi:MAG: helix-turn-helix domain-containing protein [Dehalococcoidia bacterium]
MRGKRGPKARPAAKGKRQGATWDAGQVRALRRHLGLSQQGMAREMGTRQQTVSEWETDQYRPRGASARLLAIIAEQARFEYGADASRQGRDGVKQGQGDGGEESPGRTGPSPRSES